MTGFELIASIAAAAAPAPAPPPPGADWRVVLTDSEPEVGRIIGFADAGTMARAGDQVRFWLEYRLERAAEGADGYRGHVSADCGTFTYGSTGLARLAGARVVESGGEESGLTAAPGTTMRAAIEAVCAARWQGPRVDPVAHARAEFAR
ncbi:MAG TPA: hypothetical protein VEA61_08540 [Allosphingosinicella sp.]|nr:hypothetical protein [Allosphingosinicella sp.]